MKKILPLIFISLIFLAFPFKAQAAHFYLEPQSAEQNKDQEFEVFLKLDTTNEKTSGVDIVLNFDKEVLEVKSVSFSSLYALNDAQINSSAGQLKLYSTMNSPTSSFKGNDRLATIKLKGIAQGNGKLSFSCQSGATGDDTNIWKKGGGDIVDCGALKEGNYEIKTSCPVPEVPSNIKAVTGPDPGQVSLSWNKVSGAKFYNIIYGPSSLNYLWGAANVGDVDTYIVSGLEQARPYYFTVAAVNDCGNSGVLHEVAADAGKEEEEEKYWQEPEIVQPSEEPTSETEIPEASSSASPVAKVEEKEPTKEKLLPSWLKSGWIRGLGIAVLVLVVLSLIGKRIAKKEMELGSKIEPETETPSEEEIGPPVPPESPIETLPSVPPPPESPIETPEPPTESSKKPEL